MHVIIHVRKYEPGPLPVPDLFIHEVLPALLERLGGRQVIIIADGYSEAEIPSSPGIVSMVEFAPKKEEWLKRLWWRSFRLQSILRKSKGGFLLSINNGPVRSAVRSAAWYQDDHRLLKLKAVRPQTTLVAGSRAIADRLTGQLPGAWISVTGRGLIPGFEPELMEEKQITRDDFTAGKSFFLYLGALDKGITDLVKAFSVFKKRQKSDWKLVLAGKSAPSDAFIRSLGHYRYKDDLVIMDPVSWVQVQALVKSAYAMVCLTEGPGLKLIPEAFLAGTPVLAPAMEGFREVGATAVLYMGDAGQTEIAENMMTIYKDENLRSRLINEGKLRVGHYRWSDTVEGLMQLVEGAT